VHSMMLRSETTRSAELPDFSSLDLPDEGEPTFAVTLTQNKGKTIYQAEFGDVSKTPDLAGIFFLCYTGVRVGSWEFGLSLHEKPILFRFGLL